MGSTKASARAGAQAGAWRLAAALLLAGCQAPCPFPGQGRVTRLELFFGRAMPGGGRVSDAAWQDFATRVLTPAFPDGLTVLRGVGQWRDPQRRQVVREDSFVVLVLGRVEPAAVAMVSQTYRAWFDQEAVGVVSSKACAAF